MKSLNKSLLLFTMFISLLFITSCSGLFNSNSKSGDNESEKEYIISGNVTTDFRGAIPEILSEKLNDSRSALPGKPSGDFFYKVMAFKERDYSYPDPAVCESTSNDGTFVLKIREPGTYKIACSVYQGSEASGIPFFDGEDTVVLSDDHPYNNEVELIASIRTENLNGSNIDSLTYRYGAGGFFKLYLYAENSTGINTLKYKYKHTVLNGTESEGEGLKSVDDETGNIRFLINEEVSNAGVHTLTLDFYDAADCLVYSCKEMMTIFNNCETNTWYDPSVEKSAPYLQFDDTTKTIKFLLTNELVAKFQNSVFYVGGTGASDENGGTKDKPFATVQKAVDEIQLINDEKTEYMIYLLGDVTDETDSDYSADNNRSLVNLASTKALKVKISSFGIDGEGNPNCYKINANRSFDGSNGTQGRVINVAGDYNRDGTAKNSSLVQLTLENVEICGGRLGGNGAGIIVDYNGTLILNDGAIVKNNISIGAYYGGGIELANVTATTGKETPVFVMNGGKVTENSSGSYGGGISAYTGSFTMNGGEISNNTLTGNNLTNEDECGAGVYLDCEKAAFNGGKILNNSIADDKNGNTYGTGVYVKAGTDFSITGSRETVYISGNSCENLEVSSIKGTGIYFEERTDSNSPISIKNAVIFGNVSSLNNTITENFGAGMYLNGGTFSFENVTISNNKNAKNGIGLYIGGSGTVNAIKNVQIINNISENSTVASDGCGVFINAGTFNFGDGIIAGNSSTIAGNGKGVYNDDKFIISGLAKVDESNDVYLPNGKTIKIGSKLLNSGIAAVITPETYEKTVFVLDNSAKDYVDFFKITPESGTKNWCINKENLNLEPSINAKDLTSLPNSDICTVVTVDSKEGLLKLSSFDTSGSNVYKDITIRLETDIDLENAEWNTIDSFYGKFDGNGKTILNYKKSRSVNDEYPDAVESFINVVFEGGSVTNLTIEGESSCGGMIKTVRSDSVIENCVNRIKINNTTGKNTTGGNIGSSIGGVVSNVSGGTVRNCINEADITCTSGEYCGGIAGRISSVNGKIDSCINKGNISFINDSSAECYIGGIAGNCYGILTNCSNIGDVEGTNYVGGITGYAYTSQYYYTNSGIQGIYNSYNAGNVSAGATSNVNGYIGGIAGAIGEYGKMKGNVNYGTVTPGNITNFGGIISAVSGIQTSTDIEYNFYLENVSSKIGIETSTYPKNISYIISSMEPTISALTFNSTTFTNLINLLNAFAIDNSERDFKNWVKDESSNNPILQLD